MNSRHQGDYWKTGQAHGCGPDSRAHTPIVSKKQEGLFGAELARRKAGEQGQMSGITTSELRSHLHEAKGKKLSETHHKKG